MQLTLSGLYSFIFRCASSNFNLYQMRYLQNLQEVDHVFCRRVIAGAHFFALNLRRVTAGTIFFTMRFATSNRWSGVRRS